MKYNACHLSDIAEIFSGFAFRSQDLGDSGISVIKIANIQNYRVLRECPDHFPEDLLSRKLDRYFLQNRDCLVAMTGAGSVGKFGKMCGAQGSKYLVNQRVGIIRPDLSQCDSDFVFQALSNDIYEKILYSLGLGAGQPNVSAKEIGSLEIPLPPLPTQRKIAAVLSAYDDLIENNLRRIKILEEMAQNLYREWFVKFRFPGHNHARFTDSPLGRIPEGWELATLGEIATVVTKGTTPTTFGKDFKAEGINFFKVESIDQTGGIEENKLAKIDVETHEMLKRSQIQRGDILFSIAGAIGRTTIVPQRLLPANTNQALAIIRIPDEIHRVYIFHCVRADEFQHFSLGHVVQTAQANVSLGILKSAPILMPPNAILSEFTAAALSITQIQENLRTRNIMLRRTRDLLLPRLISGEVDVSELDITIPEEAIL